MGKGRFPSYTVVRKRGYLELGAKFKGSVQSGLQKKLFYMSSICIFGPGPPPPIALKNSYNTEYVRQRDLSTLFAKFRDALISTKMIQLSIIIVFLLTNYRPLR